MTARRTGGAFSLLAGRPSFDAASAEALLAAHWRLAGAATALPSERDQNWLVDLGDGRRFVLKISNRYEDHAALDMQQQLLLRAAAAHLPCPHIVPTVAGDWVVPVEGHQVWLITELPGTRLAEVTDPSDALWPDLGSLLGRLDRCLGGFSHPGAERWMQWDVRHTGQILSRYRDEVRDPGRRRLLDAAAHRFDNVISPALGELPTAVIHNDANDHNVLVDGDHVTGLIDFGDAVHTVRVNELAVACAYAMLDRADPWRVAEAITAGFLSHIPLGDVERDTLPTLIECRLAISVAISAHQQALAPDDEYLRVSEAPAWRLLEQLTEGTG